MLAIAMVLADIAGDTRRKPAERAQAEKSLTAMTPQHIMEADFAEVGIKLLRTFDGRAAARGPATSGARLQSFYVPWERR